MDVYQSSDSASEIELPDLVNAEIEEEENEPAENKQPAFEKRDPMAGQSFQLPQQSESKPKPAVTASHMSNDGLIEIMKQRK